jgi:Na+-driven multidrug efflux pump
VGGASLVSRALGARRPDLAGRAAGNSFAIFWATAVAVTIVGLAFLDPLLRLVGATAETLPYARPYATVIVGGAIFSTGFSALVRAEGRLLFSMMLWVVPVIVQITLDPLLIFGLDMGVVGAGLGTVGGQAVSAASSSGAARTGSASGSCSPTGRRCGRSSPSARRRSSPGSGRRCSPCWSTPPWPSRAPP